MVCGRDDFWQSPMADAPATDRQVCGCWAAPWRRVDRPASTRIIRIHMDDQTPAGLPTLAARLAQQAGRRWDSRAAAASTHRRPAHRPAKPRPTLSNRPAQPGRAGQHGASLPADPGAIGDGSGDDVLHYLAANSTPRRRPAPAPRSVRETQRNARGTPARPLSTRCPDPIRRHVPRGTRSPHPDPRSHCGVILLRTTQSSATTTTSLARPARPPQY